MNGVAIIVPAFNAATTLDACLAALVQGGYTSSILVVDDGSRDATAEIARQRGVRVLTIAGPSGPAAARNAGVAATTADLLLFIDADVVAPPEAVATLIGAFTQDVQLAAAFGSYDAQPPARTAVSLFKNLLHHFVHQHANERSASFWAGFGAIRRDAFEAAGGFDATRYPRPSIEDIELGARLWRTGRPVRLVRDAQVTHLKAWTFRQLVTTDVRDRAYPWTQLLLDKGLPANDLNLRMRDRVSAVIAWSLAGALVAIIGSAGLLLIDGGNERGTIADAIETAGAAGLVVVPVSVVSLVALNRKLYGFFARAGGWWFAGTAFALHVLYYLYSSATYGFCVLKRLLRVRPR